MMSEQHEQPCIGAACLYCAAERATLDGISQAAFTQYATLADALAAAQDDRNEVALTREQAIEFLDWLLDQRRTGAIDKFPLQLMHEIRDDDCGCDEECPHCSAEFDEGFDGSRCPECGLGLDIMHFTSVMDGDVDDSETATEFLSGWDWFRLWKRG